MSRPYYKIIFKDKIYAAKKKSWGIKQYYECIRGIIVVFAYTMLSFKARIDWYYHILFWAYMVNIVHDIISKHKKMDAQLMFYEDHFLLYLPKKDYNFNVWRKEYYKIDYRQVEKIEYCQSKKEISIYGTIKTTIFRMDKKGKVLADSRQEYIEEGEIRFPTRYSKEINFVKEIERSSPLTVGMKLENK